MVSIVLLTTEEVLQRNGFWHCLDNQWIVKEMEPFEEVKPEHVFVKPLSRDFYYTKFPEIPRSESEDENSLSLNGFRSKHHEWKSKIVLRRFDAQRRNSQSNLTVRSTGSSASINDKSKRTTAVVEKSFVPNTTKNTTQTKTNDDRVREFFMRLIESVPPPPIEDLQVNSEIDCSIIEKPQETNDLSDIDLPDYADFEKNKILEQNPEHNLPSTSTLKRSQRKVSFNLNSIKRNFESSDSWYESIYGVSDIIVRNSGALIEGSHDYETIDLSKYKDLYNDSDSINYSSEYFPSWSEIMSDCGISGSILKNDDSSDNIEEIISRSHCIEPKVIDLNVDDDDDDDIGYARFAIYKIHQTLKIEAGMIDSSPLRNMEEESDNSENIAFKANTFRGSIYHLAPIDFDESVNVMF